MTTIQRGSVVLVRMDPAEGSEIRKTRPAVVVSNNAACRFDAVLQVVPLTAMPERSLRPYEARIDSRSSAVKKPSRAVANQIRSVARSRIRRHLGTVTRPELKSIERAISVQLGLPARSVT